MESNLKIIYSLSNDRLSSNNSDSPLYNKSAYKLPEENLNSFYSLFLGWD